VKPILDSGIRI